MNTTKHSRIRRILAATALAGAAAVPMISTVPAQAATTSSWIQSSAYTWHCTVHLYAYDNGPSSLYAAGRLNSNTIYQKDGKLWCDMEVDQSSDGGRTWHNVLSGGQMWYTNVANHVVWSPKYSDPGGRLTRVCLEEQYNTKSYPWYDSGWRCSAAW